MSAMPAASASNCGDEANRGHDHRGRGADASRDIFTGLGKYSTNLRKLKSHTTTRVINTPVTTPTESWTVGEVISSVGVLASTRWVKWKPDTAEQRAAHDTARRRDRMLR